MDKVIAALMRVAAFSGLTPQQLQEIARHAEKRKFSRGEVITGAGRPGDGAFVIASGPAERLEGSGHPSEMLEPGSLIGEMAMLIEHDYQSTVMARDWVFCLKITRAAMHAQMREDPSLAEHFQRRVTERLLKVAEDLRQIDAVLAAQGTPSDAATAQARSAP
jgi:CRP/FNR family cyclic AMP-dependent transcriptional regulator